MYSVRNLDLFPVVIVISEQNALISWIYRKYSDRMRIITYTALSDYEQNLELFDVAVILIDIEQVLYHAKHVLSYQFVPKLHRIIVISADIPCSAESFVQIQGFAGCFRLPEYAAELFFGIVAVWNEIICFKPAITPQYKKLLQKYAGGTEPVLLLGETGSGKTFEAKLLHTHSRRSGKPFIQVNIASIASSLIESELFGCTRGAYTGAVDHKGFFETAADGTLFLDEIGDMPLDVQHTLLTVIEDGVYYRVGSAHPLTNHARIVCATNVDLKQYVRENRFREDLYYRISAFSLTIPPLRDRLGEIPQLVDLFLAGSGKTLTYSALFSLYRYDWPGNIRELKKKLNCAVQLTEGSEISNVFAFS